MFERYTEKARRAVFFARYQASVFGSNSIESHHLLLGLFRADPELMRRVLGDEQKMLQIQAAFELEFRQGERLPTSVDLPLSHECKQALAHSDEASWQRWPQPSGAPPIAAGDVLLGLLQVEDSVAAKAVRASGVDLAAARQSIGDVPETPHTENPIEPFD